jgi:hypothetical protein
MENLANNSAAKLIVPSQFNIIFGIRSYEITS